MTMAHDDLAAKLRRDAMVYAQRLSDAVEQVIADLDDPRGFAVHTDGLPGLVHSLSEQCAALRLLCALDREGK